MVVLYVCLDDKNIDNMHNICVYIYIYSGIYIYIYMDGFGMVRREVCTSKF